MSIVRYRLDCRLGFHRDRHLFRPGCPVSVRHRKFKGYCLFQWKGHHRCHGVASIDVFRGFPQVGIRFRSACSRGRQCRGLPEADRLGFGTGRSQQHVAHIYGHLIGDTHAAISRCDRQREGLFLGESHCGDRLLVGVAIDHVGGLPGIGRPLACVGGHQRCGASESHALVGTGVGCRLGFHRDCHLFRPARLVSVRHRQCERLCSFQWEGRHRCRGIVSVDVFRWFPQVGIRLRAACNRNRQCRNLSEADGLGVCGYRSDELVTNKYRHLVGTLATR